ncbi:MAG TPA: hypothetical protein PLQ36_00255 [Candidatus Gracilibacteria bacterium]|nr:hypothetical protein [Candidatus Gracilibacteria bacterium]
MDNLDEKINRVLTFEPKLNRVLELMEKQERRAKVAIFWKWILVIFAVILPTILSLFAMRNLNMKTLNSSVPGLNTKMMEVLNP